MYKAGEATESSSTATDERPEEVAEKGKDEKTVEGEVVDEDDKK